MSNETKVASPQERITTLNSYRSSLGMLKNLITRSDSDEFIVHLYSFTRKSARNNGYHNLGKDPDSIKALGPVIEQLRQGAIGFINIRIDALDYEIKTIEENR